MKIKLTILVLLLLFGFLNSFGQKSFLDYYINQMNMKYDCPPDFIEEKIIDSTAYMPRRNSGFLNGVFYKLKPKDSDSLSIALSFFDVGPILRNRENHSSYTEKSFARTINYLLDTRPLFEERGGEVIEVKRGDVLDTTKIQMFKDMALKRYGADRAGIIDVPVDIPYLGKYHKLKILFMEKKGTGEAYIYYHYNDGQDITRYIEKTKYILTFK